MNQVDVENLAVLTRQLSVAQKAKQRFSEMCVSGFRFLLCELFSKSRVDFGLIRCDGEDEVKASLHGQGVAMILALESLFEENPDMSRVWVDKCHALLDAEICRIKTEIAALVS